MLKQIALIAPISLALVLASCGSKEEAVKDYQETTDTLSSEVRTDMNMIRAGIPSPIEVSKQISKGGYSYNKSILNSSGKSSGYSTKYQAAANLGVYGADFGYVAGYGQSQDVLEYVAQVAKLAKTVGVEAAFNEEFGKDVTQSIGKEDTLMDLIDDAYAKAEHNLRSNDRVSTTAIIVAGGWVEGLYIGCQILPTKERDTKTENAYRSVYAQVYAFEYVSDLLKQYKKDADCTKMLEELKPLSELMGTYAKNSKLTAADLQKIKEAVTPVRNKIVG